MAASTKTKSFRATLERSGDGLNWVIIRVPLDVAKIWGKRGQLRVKGEINGFPFRTSLFPTGKGTHVMMVNKKMQKGGAAWPGTTAQFRLEPDLAERFVRMPKELERVLGESKRLRKYFDALNYSIRKWIADSVAERKQTESRSRLRSRPRSG